MTPRLWACMIEVMVVCHERQEEMEMDRGEIMHSALALLI